MTVKGTIVGSQIAYIAQGDVPYGYVDVLTGDNKHVHFKVDANTEHEKLDTGLEVEAELEYLGDSKILRAKTVRTTDSTEPSEAEALA